MTTADALLAAVLAAPDDDLPRLVYADFLEETGDPDRAEFIRVQVALARGESADGLPIRERVLRDTNGERWLAPLRRRGEPLFTRRSHAAFHRGFLETVWLPATEFVKHAERLFAVAPVRELRVMFDEEYEVRRFATCEQLDRLRVLDVCDPRFGPGCGVEFFVRNPHLTELRVLRLSGCNLDELAARSLCEHAPPLDELDLRHNPLSDAARARLRDRFGNAVRFE